MKKYILLFVLIPAFFFALPHRALANDISFSIEYHNKQIYFTNSSVLVQANIYNNSSDSYLLKLADNKRFNIDFDVRTSRNQPLSRSKQFITDLASNQQVFYRDLVIEAGESLSFVVDLADFIALDTAGIYVLKARLYANLNRGQFSQYIESNSLSLSLRPHSGIAEFQARIDDETGAILHRTAMPPDEVVRYIIQARQTSQWDKFFLYMDLEEFIMKNPQERNRFIRLSEAERNAFIEEYKRRLMLARTDTDIVMIPSSYDIIYTSYTSNDAEVQVVQRFEQSGYTEVKRYHYYLFRKDSIWMVRDYSVTNLGTE